MNKAILDKTVQEYIRANLGENLSKLILKGSPFPQVSIQEIATQISGLQKAKQKLPTWYNTNHIIFPPSVNLEQTSSEVTAKYKASLVSGKELIDLTGGLGIDSFYFAESVEQLTYCELNQDLAEVASHNFKALQKHNITTIAGDGLEYLKASPQSFDWIYLDPARRDSQGGKVFHLDQCTPNVPQHLKLLFHKGEHLMVKTSPLLDLTAGLLELGKVAEIHIVSVQNEVKELLWILHKSSLSTTRIKTINFLNLDIQQFEAAFEESNLEAPLSLPGLYIFEPNPAIMKSGLFASLALQTNTKKLHQHSHLYTGDTLTDFPGRKFELIKILPYSKKALKNALNLTKANITTRNFPKTVETLRKELKIEDGGETYLFFTTNLREEKIVLVCRKA